MRIRRWAPLAVAPLLAVTSIAGLSAQEEQEKQQEHQARTHQPEQGQQDELTVRLEAVENSAVNGTAVVRFVKKGEEPARPEAQETEPERVEITYDLTGLEADGSYEAVIHQGACATGTTLVARLGTLTADEGGQLRTTAEVEDQEAIAALADARDIATGFAQRTAEREQEETQEREAEQEQMALEGERQDVRHLQLQSNGEPVACGDFEVEPKS